MSPYQRAAAVAVAPRPAPAAPVAAGRGRWRGRGERATQAAVGFALAVVLAAMVCNRLDVVDRGGRDPGVVDAAVHTWALDAVTLLVLAAGAVVHSVVRRGRPGRWPVAVLGVVAVVSVVLVPAFAG